MKGAASRKSRSSPRGGGEDVGRDKERRAEIGGQPFDAGSGVHGVADDRVFQPLFVAQGARNARTEAG